MGLSEDRANLMDANVALGEALAKLYRVVEDINTAQVKANAAITGYDNVELVEASGEIALASESAGETFRAVASAQGAIDRYIRKLNGGGS
jgi:hypothetical protein